MKKLLLLLVSLVMVEAHASIVPEIEDYYNKKASDFVQTRFPNRPYTVFVKVDAGDARNVKRGEIADRKTTTLPYLDVTEDNNDFWARTDLPLASFLPYLKSVYLKVELDAHLTDAEFVQFKEDLFKYLKLNAATDKIDALHMKWSPQNEVIPRNYIYGLALGVPFLLIFMFTVITRMSVHSLIKGLADPLKNISKSTEAFAGQSVAVNQGKKSFESEIGQKEFAGGENERAQILDLLSKTKLFFNDLDGKTLSFVERWGEQYPTAMGAILVEMNSDVVKELFRWGTGAWWTASLTQPGQWNKKMFMILTEAHQELRKAELMNQKNVISSEEKMLSLALARLSPKEIGIILKGKNLETIEPVLALLPQSVVINVCKYMYPGEWGKIVDKRRLTAKKISETLRKETYSKAIEIKALRDESDVNLLFLEADLVKYLNTAVTKDEREVYRTLSEKSNIVKNRFPFYRVFEASSESLKKLAADISLEDWAAAMIDCDREEVEKALTFFTDRQKFLVRSMTEQIKDASDVLDRKIVSKRFIAQYAYKTIWAKEDQFRNSESESTRAAA
jgi:hypothetical protein